MDAHNLFSLIVSLALLAVLSIAPSIANPFRHVSAHSGDVFGPACGAATIDGQVDPTEWSGATMQTFVMAGSISTPLTTTLRVMNSANNLYLGIAISDDEFSPIGQFLPQGDTFRVDFDNDHGGSLFDLGDDVLGISAGSPHFMDNFIDGDPVPSSSDEDIHADGTIDGAGAASRVVGLNYFEVRHPLCSGDPLDFCLQGGQVVGFRLEYLDAEANGSFGGSGYFPGNLGTSVADIVIGTCMTTDPDPDLFGYLPAIWK
jgi:hypothetical protein